jgi:hypothetical protein
MKEIYSDNDCEPVGSFIRSALSIKDLDELFIRNSIPYVLHGSRCEEIMVPKPLAKKASEMLWKSELRGRVTIY